MTAQRRTQSRHDVEITAALQVKEEGLDATIDNLSLGGCFLRCDVRMPINQRVELEFRVPTHEAPIRVGGTVRWSSDSGAGVQFDGLRAAEVWSLNKYFERLRDE